MEWILVKTVAWLAAVVGLMVGLAVIVRKLFYGSHPKDPSRVDIEVLGHRALAPKRTVFVLRVHGRLLVVGVTEQGISTLSELEDVLEEDGSTVDALRGSEQCTSPTPRFIDYFGKHFPVIRWSRIGTGTKVEG